MQVSPEIDKKETISVSSSEKAQRKGFGSQHRAVQPIRPLFAKDRVFATQTQEVFVQREHVRIPPALLPIQLGFFECRPIVRSACRGFGTEGSDTGKLA